MKGRRTMKAYRLILFVIFTALILSACALPGSVVPSTGNETPPTQSPEPQASPEPGEILVQLDYEPTFSLIQMMYPFGRIPPFTLYADGRLIYVDEGETFDQQQVMEVRLTPEEAQELLNQVLGFGFERLESYTDFCEQNPDGTQSCIADAAFTIIRAREPGGELREVKIYANFAEDKQAFEEITAYLTDYTHPDAQPYVPQHATLFIQPYLGEPVDGAPEWPLSPAYLEISNSDLNLQAWALEGDDLQSILSVVSRNTGDFTFTHEGEQYSAYIVPWLPGVDYADQIAESFPPANPAESETP